MGMAASRRSTHSSYRQLIGNGVAPDANSLSEEVVYGQYFFDHKSPEPKDTLNLTFNTAITKCLNPLYHPKDEQYWISIGFESCYDGKKGLRKPMKLFFLLDISGSMEREFNPVKPHQHSRLDVVKENLVYIINNHMLQDDEVCVIAFEKECHVIQHLQVFHEIDKTALCKKINGLIGVGKADLDNAAKKVISIVHPELSIEALTEPPKKVTTKTTTTTTATTTSLSKEPQILLFSDLSNIHSSPLKQLSMGKYQLNYDALTRHDKDKDKPFFTIAKMNSAVFMYGLEIETHIVNEFSAISGCSVVSGQLLATFQKELDETFEFSLCPIADSVEIEIHSSPMSISGSYGGPSYLRRYRSQSSYGYGGSGFISGYSDDYNSSSSRYNIVNDDDGKFLEFPTLFPSARKSSHDQNDQNKGTKGGIVLLNLFRKKNVVKSEANTLQPLFPIGFGLKYYDRINQCIVRKVYKVEFPDPTKYPNLTDEFYSSNGIQKAILLHTYVRFASTLISKGSVGMMEVNTIRSFSTWFESNVKLVGDFSLLEEAKTWESLREIIPESSCTLQ